ncbi:MAG TPA: hypothetical protein VEI97_17390, partial [bacterium]|nr:hypothetical protein [bacterium]
MDTDGLGPEALTPAGVPMEPAPTAVPEPVDRWSFRNPPFVWMYLLLVVIATAVVLPLPLGAYLYPAALAGPALPVLYRRYAAGDLPGALAEMLWAAVWMTGAMLLAFPWAFPLTRTPDGTLAGVAPVLRGAAYVEEMQTWLATGLGPESDPRQFIPIHLRHFAIVGVSSLLTAGAAAFYFGAIQMAYMNAYVYAVASQTTSLPAALTALVMAWHVWSVVRVVSFITLATALGYPLYAQLKGLPQQWPLVHRMVVAAVVLEVLDLVLKALLAE